MSEHLNPADLAPPPAPVARAFRIDWAIELSASSPAEAAAFAAEIQYQDNTATNFSVTDKQTGEVTIHDMGVDGVVGTNLFAKRPEDTGFTARSLRPGGKYQTRDGQPVDIIRWDRTDTDFPLEVKIHADRGGIIAGIRTKAGHHPQGQGKPHPLDVVEVNPATEKWVRLYDRKLNAAGKQVVAGKEFAAERGLFMYVFDTEAEARANLQGVRAVFPIRYREGEGLG